MVTPARELLPQLASASEVIVVNNGSRASAKTVLGELARQHKRIRIIHPSVKRGSGGALHTSFLNTTKDWIFYTGGDGQEYDVRE